MKWVFAGIALAAAAFGATPAFAQINKQGGPIQVTASTLEALTDQGRYIYTTNVDAVQGDARLKSDKLTVICTLAPVDPKTPPASRANQSCGEVKTLLAEGAVHYITPDARIVGTRAEYDYTNKVITVTGDVVLSREDGSIVNGTRLIYEVDAGKATMTSDNGKGVLSYFNTTPKKETAAPGTPPAASPAPAAPAPR